MSFIPKDWFEQILSKVNGSDFDRNDIPDLVSASIFDGNKEIAKWDLTEELQQNGIARINFTNSTLNVDVQFLFMHKDLKDKLADNVIFQNLMDQSKNYSNELGLSPNVSFISFYEDNYRLYGTTYGTFTLLAGLIGLLLKIRATRRPKVVKVTWYAFSIWCILTGILMLLELITEHGLGLGDPNTLTIDKTHIVTISAVSPVLLKVLLISLKLFTIVIYIFQNTMIYRPFFFRQHKKALSKWVLGISAGQSAGVFIVLIAWSIVLVFNHEDGDCHDVLDRSNGWLMTVQSLMLVGYLGSLLLSLIFIAGFYRKSAKKVGGSERKNIKKTMIACSN